MYMLLYSRLFGLYLGHPVGLGICRVVFLSGLFNVLVHMVARLSLMPAYSSCIPPRRAEAPAKEALVRYNDNVSLHIDVC